MADQAFKQGLARIKRPADLKAYIEHRMWGPHAFTACCTLTLKAPGCLHSHLLNGSQGLGCCVKSSQQIGGVLKPNTAWHSCFEGAAHVREAAGLLDALWRCNNP